MKVPPCGPLAKVVMVTSLFSIASLDEAESLFRKLSFYS